MTRSPAGVRATCSSRVAALILVLATPACAREGDGRDVPERAADICAGRVLGSNADPIVVALARCGQDGATARVVTLLEALPLSRRGRADARAASADADPAKLFGVRCDGASGTDNTAAINRMATALADAPLPPGVCRITGKLTVPPGHTLRAQGRFATTLAVRPDFDMAADSVIGLGRGSRLRDASVDFAQPDSGARARWTRYPTAISALGSGGEWEIDRVRVQRATKALDMRGEQGRARIGLFEASASEMGVDIDGSHDSVHVGTLRCWSYGLTPAQYGVIIDRDASVNGGEGPICLNSGKMDGLIVDELFSIFYPKAVRFYYSTGYATRAANGITTGLINKLQLDTTGGFLCEWCDVSVSAAYINVGAPGYTAMIVRGGAVNVGQLNIATFGTVDFRGQPNPATDGPLIQLDNNANAPRVTITGLSVETGGSDRTLLRTAAPNPAHPPPQIAVGAVNVHKDPAKAYTQPVFDLPVGSGTILGLSINGLTTGSGTLFAMPNDLPLTIVAAPTAGWRNALPAVSRRLSLNFGFDGQTLALPAGSVHTGGAVAAEGPVIAAAGLFTGAVAAPVQVVDERQNVRAAKFGANGAAPSGRCPVPPPLAPGGNDFERDALLNALRACLDRLGLVR